MRSVETRMIAWRSWELFSPLFILQRKSCFLKSLGELGCGRLGAPSGF